MCKNTTKAIMFQGKIYDVKIYNRALSAIEIFENFKGRKASILEKLRIMLRGLYIRYFRTTKIKNYE